MPFQRSTSGVPEPEARDPTAMQLLAAGQETPCSRVFDTGFARLIECHFDPSHRVAPPWVLISLLPTAMQYLVETQDNCPATMPVTWPLGGAAIVIQPEPFQRSTRFGGSHWHAVVLELPQARQNFEVRHETETRLDAFDAGQLPFSRFQLLPL